MENRITISQPYIVIFEKEDRSCDKDVLKWIRENIKGKLEILLIGINAEKLLVLEDRIDSFDMNHEIALMLFANQGDALLFKLTWGGK